MVIRLHQQSDVLERAFSSLNECECSQKLRKPTSMLPLSVFRLLMKKAEGVLN